MLFRSTGQRIDTVQVQIGQTNATVQQVSQAQVTADGKASAMWSVKLQVNAQGQYVAAGVGLGIENTGAGLQSQFLVSADRFAVVNGINGALVSPFAVQGGQVFMNSAVIRQADIINLIVTGVLKSGNYIAGTQGIRIDFVSGNFEINGSSGGGRQTINNAGGKVYDAGGVKRYQWGDLSV